MNRDIASFPIPPNIRLKLRQEGFANTEDLEDIGPVDLSKEASISKEEALDVLKLIFAEKYDGKKDASPVAISALDVYKVEQELGEIITFCEQLDNALGGGIPLTKLTEICGPPGVGKTQFCLQLSVNVRILKELGGICGECIFIDTEGSFTIKRLSDVAEAMIKHCQEVAKMQSNPGLTNSLKSFTLENVLSGIHVFHCIDSVELIATINLLADFLDEHRLVNIELFYYLFEIMFQVKLIIIDSIAFPFRNNFNNDISVRTKLLGSLSQSLFQIAYDYKLAVVLSNQMTSRLDDKKCLTLIPALGESWGHVCTNRIILNWKDECRYANLYKSPSRPEANVPFIITTSGIRDHVSEETNYPDVKRRKM
ncbi:DNA repair protein RAD51 3 [Nymphon striatum]|nr:DNA repair protein RAD51 3 [Nymphon striatum]